MFKYNLLISFRQLYRHKGYSAINIIGFAIGLTACLLMAFYVIDEMTYDKYYEGGENIYRMITHESEDQGENRKGYGITSGMLVTTIKDDIPEIVASARVKPTAVTVVTKIDDKSDIIDTSAIRTYFIEADIDYFNIFTHKLINGNITSAYSQPEGFVITDALSKKLFGDGDPIGRKIQLSEVCSGTVAAVIKKPPHNTHLRFDIIKPLIITDENRFWFESWENLLAYGYIKVLPGTDPTKLLEDIKFVGAKNEIAEIFEPGIQALHNVHFKSVGLIYDHANFGRNDISRVHGVMIIAILVLITASINFINLATARSAKRAREVGIRKVIGAKRTQLIYQYLTETIMMTVIAMALAIVIAELLIPALNEFIGKDFDNSYLRNPLVLLSGFSIAIIVGIISGLYPTMVLSAFKPSKVLKGQFSFSSHGIILRRILVVSQFVVPITMISCSIIVMNQVKYIEKKNLGYTRDNVLVISVMDEEAEKPFSLMKNELEQLAGVNSIGTISHVPGAGENVIRYEVVQKFPGAKDINVMFTAFTSSTDALKTLEINMVKGQIFNDNDTTGITEHIIINETAAHTLGWNDPVGKYLTIIDIDGSEISKEVVGVFNDYHLGSTRKSLEPMMIGTGFHEQGNWAIAKLDGKENVAVAASIKDLWTETMPNSEFIGYYLDDVFQKQFRFDRVFASGIEILAGVAGLIACLGLIGLVAFSIEQRRHSIAIRKVLGCDEFQIVMSLTGEIIKWVVVANLIAWPLGYVAMRKWLEGFIYQVPLSPMPFMYAGIAALTIAVLTVSVQTLRAARANPAVCLRVET